MDEDGEERIEMWDGEEFVWLMIKWMWGKMRQEVGDLGSEKVENCMMNIEVEFGGKTEGS